MSRARRQPERSGQSESPGNRDGIVFMDDKGRCVDANATACRTLGLARGGLLGRDMAKLLGLGRGCSAAWSSLRTNGQLSGETRTRHGEIGERALEYHALADFQPGRHLVILRDVTEQRRAHEGMRRLAAIVESSDDTIFSITLDGKITSWNAAAERTLAYSREEVLGQSALVLASPDRREELRKAVDGMRRGRLSTQIETIWVTKHGARLQVSISIAPIVDEADRVFEASVIARDITQRAQLEDQLRRAQKMEAVSRVSAGLAHDFNNLLNVIATYSEAVRLQLGHDDPLRGLMTEMIGASDRASALIRQLLSFGRRQLVAPAELDINEMVRGLAPILTKILGSDVALTTTLTPRLGRVRADRGQIEQVLMNLVMNARDAMPDGGTVRIETRNVLLDDQAVSTRPLVQPGPYVAFSVTDTGTGMDSEVLARAFEPFYTTKSAGEGSGLGLAIVHGTITQSHGHLNVSTEPGKGTSIEVFLPRLKSGPSVRGKSVRGVTRSSTGTTRD